ncbi:Cell division cycle 7-related protein kinase [Nymphon striatum]|nr:Cell division cycle 7-related protein kinase [Nymphon striatum]
MSIAADCDSNLVINQSIEHRKETNEHVKDDDVQNKISRLFKYMPSIREILHVTDKIGEGAFSTVFSAKVKLKSGNLSEEKYAVKYLNPTCLPERILNELKCLHELRYEENIVRVEHCLRHDEHVAIIMPYISHYSFHDLIKEINVEEAKDYMQNLFIALANVHSHDIIHRDVKPGNFLYCRKTKRYALCDFGLAQKVTNVTANELLQKLSPAPINSTFVKLEDINKSNSMLGNRISVSSSSEKGFNITSYEQTKKKTSKNQENDINSRKRPSEEIIISHGKTMKGVLESDNQRTNIEAGLEIPPNHNSVNCLTPNVVNNFDESNLSKIPQTVPQAYSDEKLPNKNTRSCCCYGRPMVCDVCLLRKHEVVQRAGTPGFRPPEVLMKSATQTTAVDMWAAGVMLLCILSRRYPFFRAVDDLTALAEIITLLGSKAIKSAASSYQKHILFQSEMHEAMDFKLICETLFSSNKKSTFNYPDSAYDLLQRLLDPNFSSRITASEALKHPFISSS